MSILSQIQCDITTIQEQIKALRSSLSPLQNDLFLGREEREQREAAFKKIKKLNMELLRLQMIIKLGFVPPSYTSTVTEITYTPSDDEQSAPKPPEIHSVFANKRSRKKDSLPKSEFTLFTSGGRPILSFLVEHQFSHSYPNGNIGKVKRAFSPEDKEPRYALKVFKDRSGCDTFHESRIAMRGAWCYNLLGYRAHAFRHADKQYLLSEWLPGATLAETSRDKIIAIPVRKRIIFTLKLIREIALLHKHGIYHNDIKPSNLMLSDKALHLIDFDGVRLKNEEIASKYHPVHTKAYLDAQTNYDISINPNCLYKKLDEKSNIYALGLSLAFLFPDIISPAESVRFVTINKGAVLFEFDSIALKYGDKYHIHEQLGQLLLRLSDDAADKRPEIEQVFNELTTLLDRYEGASPDEILPKPLEERPPAKTGETAFDEIESELLFLKVRNDSAKKAIQGNPLPKIQQLTYNNTFYLLAGAASIATAAAFILLNGKGSLQSEMFTKTIGAMLLGGAALASYGIFSPPTVKIIGQDNNRQGLLKPS